MQIENFDFVSLAADRTAITVYKLRAQAEVVDISLIFSLKFREPELLVDIESQHA